MTGRAILPLKSSHEIELQPFDHRILHATLSRGSQLTYSKVQPLGRFGGRGGGSGSLGMFGGVFASGGWQKNESGANG